MSSPTFRDEVFLYIPAGLAASLTDLPEGWLRLPRGYVWSILFKKRFTYYSKLGSLRRTT